MLLSAPLWAQGLPQVVGKERTISVVAGDSLYQLGLRYGLAIEHFAFANGLPVQLTVSQASELKVPTRRILPASPPETGLVVNLPERGVFLFRDGAFDKFYPVAIGQPGRFATPCGNYTLVSRVKDPTWMPPEWAGLGKDTVVPAGPENPLGDRWMGLSLGGLGLHSTTQPASIGSAASHGCLRMYPQGARELFDKVAEGYPVRIEYETVKLGRDPENGGLYLTFFPDVYGSQPVLSRAQEVLASAGVSDWVEPSQLEKWARAAQGVPIPLAESMLGLVVAGVEQRLPGSLLRSAQGLWMSVEALRALGVVVNYDPLSKGLQCTYKEQNFAFAPEGLVRLEGKSYLPVRATLTTLAIPFHWDGSAKALVID